MFWLRVVWSIAAVVFVFYFGWTVGKALMDIELPPRTRVEVRIESPYPDFTCQEDELMVWVDRENGLARCVNIEEFEAAL